MKIGLDECKYTPTYNTTSTGHLIAFRNVSFNSEQTFRRDGCERKNSTVVLVHIHPHNHEWIKRVLTIMLESTLQGPL